MSDMRLLNAEYKTDDWTFWVMCAILDLNIDWAVVWHRRSRRLRPILFIPEPIQLLLRVFAAQIERNNAAEEVIDISWVGKKVLEDSESLSIDYEPEDGLGPFGDYVVLLDAEWAQPLDEVDQVELDALDVAASERSTCCRCRGGSAGSWQRGWYSLTRTACGPS